MGGSRDSTPLVSVIVPAYNAEDYIRDALQSIRHQTYRNLEVVVVDDGSTDATAAVIGQVARQDPRIKLLQQANQGVAAARNAAIRASSGTLIAPVDADDIWFPDKLQRQVQTLQKACAATAVVYAWSVNLDAEGWIVSGKPVPDVRGHVYAAFVYRNYCCASAPLIRRSCLDRVGLYDTGLRERGGEGCEDLDLLLRLARHYPFELVPRFLVGYRMRPGSMCCNVEAMERSFLLVMDKVRRAPDPLPPRLLHWAHGRFYLHLADKSLRGDDYGRGLRYLGRAAAWDPALLLLAGTYRRYLRALIRGYRPAPQGTGPQPDALRYRGRARYRSLDEFEQRRAGRPASGICFWRQWRERRLDARLRAVREWSSAMRPVRAARVGGTLPVGKGMR